MFASAAPIIPILRGGVCTAGAAATDTGPTDRTDRTEPVFRPQLTEQWRPNAPNATRRCISVSERLILNSPFDLIQFTAALCLSDCVNIGGAGSYVYDDPVNEAPAGVSMETDAKPAEEKKLPHGDHFSSFSGGPNICPRCNKTVYFAEKVSSLGKNWHRPVCAKRDAVRLWPWEPRRARWAALLPQAVLRCALWTQRRKHWRRGQLHLR
ncbi:hypothetical protein Q5P01_004645 [Channa striata]|uniref:Uncharacterized protein n=1 Tax=Channa striata TaxID=64152 RepID=A0AA88T0K2_CHASR|nr:hypothetical protein Q5P01_004645 [Channa striata]